MKLVKYAVLDKNGKKLDQILVEDPYPQDFYPGYGRYITCEYGEDKPTPPTNLLIKTGTEPFSYLMLRPKSSFEIGDTMSLRTGEILIVEPMPEPEPVVEPVSSKSILRYAVLDENGKKLNTILVSNPYPENYWPGYGRYIARDYNEERPAGLENNEIRTGDRPFSYLATIPMSAFSIGDTMDLMTGEITYAPIPEPEPEPEETIEEELL